MYVCNAAVCVLEKMLLLDPEQRVTASEALDLPFFSEFRDTEEETEALPYDQTMDNTDLPLDQWKRERESREAALDLKLHLSIFYNNNRSKACVTWKV